MALFNIKKEKSEEKAKKSEEDKNLYTNIFEKKAEKKEEDSKIISGVFAKKKAEKPKKEEHILGELPELEKKIIGAFDPTKRNMKIVRSLFIILVVLSILSIGFFYIELNPEFDLFNNLRGPNTAQQLNNSEAEVISAQTSINQKNLLLLHYYLDELSYLSDTYAKARTDNIPVQNLINIQSRITLAYENAQAKWKEPREVGKIEQNVFVNELRTVFQSDIQALKQEEQTSAIVQQIEDNEAAARLNVNTKLNSFFNKNTDNLKQNLPQDDSLIFAMTQEALAILQNDFSVISSIKKDRIAWSVIVNEIERVTKTVDNLYNTGFFEDLGGIQYAAYDFDSATNRIVLSGRVKRDDGSTFTLITNLIDALENSELFANVDNRSYPKTGTQEAGFVSTFRIELTFVKENQT